MRRPIGVLLVVILGLSLGLAAPAAQGVPLDHFMCYRAKTTKGTPKFKPREVSLADEFEAGLFDVKAPVRLCNPADKNGEGIHDPGIHLEGYQINLTKTDPPQPKHIKQTNLEVKNQFGTITVDTVKPELLLVPSTKSLTGRVDPPDLAIHDVDHYKCYEVKVTPGTDKFPKGIQAFVVDQFEEPKRFDLKKPARLCTPVDKDGEGIKNPNTLLTCYWATPAKREPEHIRVFRIHVNNQFGPEQVETAKEVEEEICVPSEKAGIEITTTVPVDIKPQSCPNPLNVADRGVLPVAILGTAGFDVTQIDKETVRLEAVSPLQSGLEDVASPFVPFTGKEDALDCTGEGPDGFLDLTLKFDTQEVVTALGPVTDGEVRVLQLTGNLLPTFGGTPIVGEDVVVILKKP